MKTNRSRKIGKRKCKSVTEGNKTRTQIGQTFKEHFQTNRIMERGFEWIQIANNHRDFND